ncbi:MAG: 3D domain-containing protein [Phycisphaerae bacterium]|nr:3D domain-containing protein [Phycisphaerae bacterium]
MATFQDAVMGLWSGCRRTRAGRIALAASAAALTASSAVAVKELESYARPLAMVDVERTARVEPVSWTSPIDDADDATADATADDSTSAGAGADANAPIAADASIRWFDGRPIRPARTITMVVTAYSPDARSCPGTDDGLTATLHPVTTNGHRLVAADTRLLPFGSMLSIPGYDSGQVVPVLDVGGAIKGHRLDVLFPTHEEARKWGRKRLAVTVWEYADGKPAPSPRKVR